MVREDIVKEITKDWKGLRVTVSNPEELIWDLALGLGDASRGKISSADKLLHHTIHALLLLTVVLVLVLYGSPKIVAVLYGSPKMVEDGHQFFVGLPTCSMLSS